LNSPPEVESPNVEISESGVQTRKKSWFKEFFATFFTIFAAEFGDKTQLATLMISAESHSPWIVFLGAASALIMTSLVGVLVGRWLAKNVTEETLEIITGASLLLIAVLLLWDMVQL
jgi:Ca2+/H+ antiporter, TMEM165/GDT1 family